MILQPGDIFLSRSNSWFGRAIRWFTREGAEPATKVNHVGIIVEGGPLDQAVAVEALQTVKRHSFWDARVESGGAVAVFRPLNLTPEQTQRIVRYCEAQVGKRYGYHKIVLHGLRKFGPARAAIDRVWSRVGWDRYPICSYLVARAFETCGLDFGVAATLAVPDDIWDFCRDHPEKYELILPLTPVS